MTGNSEWRAVKYDGHHLSLSSPPHPGDGHSLQTPRWCKCYPKSQDYTLVSGLLSGFRGLQYDQFQWTHCSQRKLYPVNWESPHTAWGSPSSTSRYWTDQEKAPGNSVQYDSCLNALWLLTLSEPSLSSYKSDMKFWNGGRKKTCPIIPSDF